VLPKQRNEDVREELLKFHSKYYSANIMGLSVLGKGAYNDSFTLDSILRLFNDWAKCFTVSFYAQSFFPFFILFFFCDSFILKITLCGHFFSASIVEKREVAVAI